MRERAILVDGIVVAVKDRRAVELPMLWDPGAQRGLRVWAGINDARPTIAVLIQWGDGLLLLQDPGSPEGRIVSVSVTPTPAREARHVPTSLAARAFEAGLDLSGLSEGELALIITMLRESEDEEIRLMRENRVLESLVRSRDAQR